MVTQEKRAIAVGSQLFVDLWSLEGFEGIICENPSEIHVVYRELLDESIAFIIAEETWFRNLPDNYRKRFEKMQNPVWIPFPSLQIETD
ncbi:MAG: cell division protein [Aminobacterium sp.]|jgi:vacuolar-type H+-ATPase subunit F/Vma7|uniref:cell division protein n=1 Tax=unclassified Aminobacterium TaxID=2685012 RepID=UPI001BD08C30|nr:MULTISPECIES: cell division protein [unclassified Aminobacterium]MDD2205890.1 cell division protein [Aminobacterium sp.]MDD3426628.1 cell division protein [Aminobacterium sp.]MDD3706661.1 cell division protein [Aminobacterium sp.]MDD4228095.1 cell division protein [Aminobacterium sp.]MDD4550840.1 cell division protein [Aminobacterium sp.]